MLGMQAFVNMAVAVNLIPVTGQPLPLISRGGTSTLITCAYFGIILSAGRFGQVKKKVATLKDSSILNVNEEQSSEDESTNNEAKLPKPLVREEYASEVEFEIVSS